MRFRIVESITEYDRLHGWTNAMDKRSKDMSDFIVELETDEDNPAETEELETIYDEEDDRYYIIKCREVDRRGKAIPGTVHYRASFDGDIVTDDYIAYKTFKDAKCQLDMLKEYNRKIGI